MLTVPRLYLYRVPEKWIESLSDRLEQEDIHPVVVERLSEIERGTFVLLTGEAAVLVKPGALEELQSAAGSNPVIFLGDLPEESLQHRLDLHQLSPSLPDDVFLKYLNLVFENMFQARQVKRLEESRRVTREKLYQLQNIGLSLISEKDLERLLWLILEKLREVTNSDAGSLYLVEESDGGRKLRAKLSQNDSIPIESREFVIPVDKSSIAGYVASTGEVVAIDEVYDIDPERGLTFNREFDELTGYRSKSMIVVPMKNKDEEVLGVVQLINKRDPSYAEPIRNDVPDVERYILPYHHDDQQILLSLANQAAIVYENQILYESIERTFEGFINASVTAIESRDPATSGHSERVTIYTLKLAEAVNRVTTGPYADFYLGEKEMRELRVACILHDFGKVGVRENVLVKEKKLYPGQFTALKERFKVIIATEELRYQKRLNEIILQKGADKYRGEQNELYAEWEKRRAELEKLWRVIERANEPSPLPEEQSNILQEIREMTYIDVTGQERPFLTEEEVNLLSIPKGTLNSEERKEIESHVTHSYTFLLQIPWTRDLRGVPRIAYGHHEFLDGTGYPLGLKAEDLLPQTRMMTIADIYDALTAADRPYKKAIPVEKALRILEFERDAGHIDAELFRIFVDEEIYRCIYG